LGTFFIKEMASTDIELAKRLYELLAEPFSLSILDYERLQTQYNISLGINNQYIADIVAKLEPYPIWNEEFLTTRLNVYQATGNPLAAKAADDLENYMKHAPHRFDLTSQNMTSKNAKGCV